VQSGKSCKHSVAAQEYRSAGSVGAFRIANVVAVPRWFACGWRRNCTAEVPHKAQRTVISPESPATHAESMHRIRFGM
jgi:hypothetical protein